MEQTLKESEDDGLIKKNWEQKYGKCCDPLQNFPVLISAYLDCESNDEDERIKVLQHLSECPACQKYAEPIIESIAKMTFSPKNSYPSWKSKKKPTKEYSLYYLGRMGIMAAMILLTISMIIILCTKPLATPSNIINLSATREKWDNFLDAIGNVQPLLDKEKDDEKKISDSLEALVISIEKNNISQAEKEDIKKLVKNILTDLEQHPKIGLFQDLIENLKSILRLIEEE